jgi:hypothetical protein
MSSALRPPASAVPTLTEVVGFESATPDSAPSEPDPHDGFAGSISAAVLPLRAPSTVTIDEELLIQHVLVDVQRQVDRMFEFRVRETIGPAFARLLEGFIQETRHDLELTLRDVVRRAVAQELARHRPR